MPRNDERPAPNGVTVNQATAEAGFSALDVSGQPGEPPVAVEATAQGADGLLEVTMAGSGGHAGGTVQIFLPQGVPVIRRISIAAVTTNTIVGTGGTVTLYWGDAQLQAFNA